MSGAWRMRFKWRAAMRSDRGKWVNGPAVIVPARLDETRRSYVVH